jgi:hypothetical protein
MAALDKRIKARETQVELCGHTYTIRRPTAKQRIDYADGTRLDLARACVVDWDMQEIDLIPGGAPVPAPFERGLWNDWLDDTPELWMPLIEAVEAAIARHDAALEDAAKN